MNEPANFRAPAVAKLLEAAQAKLLGYEGEIGAAALAEIEGGPGAVKAMQALDVKIAECKAEIIKLEAAHNLAKRNDRVAMANADAMLRAEQLQVFERAGAERVKAMSEIIGLIAKATRAYDRYVIANQEMITAVPTGTRLPVMSFDGGDDGPWLGNCELLISREAYRVANLAGAPALFFARPPVLSKGMEADRMRPAVEKLEETQAAVLCEITGQVAKLNREALTAAGVPVPPEVIKESPRPPPKMSLGEALAVVAPPVPRAALDNPALPEPLANPAPQQPAFDAFAMTDAAALAGITAMDCSAACSEAGCVLTGGPACAHPFKGGLRRHDKDRPEVLARYAEACKAVGAKNVIEVAP